MLIRTKGIPIRYMLEKIRREVTIVAIIGVAFSSFTYIFSDRLPEMPLGVPAFLGTAISVLLSFKMSQSYERWWEARKIWGSIVNDSRTLLLQLQSYLDPSFHMTITKIGHRQIAWCYALGDSLRGLNPLTRDTGCLSPEDIEQIATHQNQPLAILQQQALAIKELGDQQVMDPYCRVQLDRTVVRLVDSMGRAERINYDGFSGDLSALSARSYLSLPDYAVHCTTGCTCHI